MYSKDPILNKVPRYYGNYKFSANSTEALHAHESDRRYTVSGTKFSRDAPSVLDLNLVPIHD